ncbi:unnamed protein product, partial [Amoebophrya sp. A120]
MFSKAELASTSTSATNHKDRPRSMQLTQLASTLLLQNNSGGGGRGGLLISRFLDLTGFQSALQVGADQLFNAWNDIVVED